MRILYLASARDDLAWLRHYYREVFPDGAARALRHLMAAEGLLRTNPLVGRRTGIGDSRELHIARTPFSLITIAFAKIASKSCASGTAGETGQTLISDLREAASRPSNA